MSVQARFFVQRSIKNAYDVNARQIEMSAVVRGPENKTWASATPVGKIEMTVNNPAAALWFDEMCGQELAVTFEPRPIVCSACKNETLPNSYIEEDGKGGFRHGGGKCPE